MPVKKKKSIGSQRPIAKIVDTNPRAIKGHNKPPKKNGKWTRKNFVPNPSMDSAVHAALQLLINQSANAIAKAANEHAEKIGDPSLRICAGTVVKWRQKIVGGQGTRWPSSRTLRAALAPLGYAWGPVKAH